jgi:hypothetical protein
MNKIITGAVSSSPKITKPEPTKEKMWVFSFRFFQQYKNFGFNGDGSKINISWFSSVFQRFQELGCMRIDDVVNNPRGHRYHKINWSARNIPITYKELDWIDDCYKSNEDEYPLVQFDISKAFGRVAGFWDEDLIFQVVLLDPLHNLQPSNYNNYKIVPCDVLDSEITAVVNAAQKAHEKCTVEKCEARQHISDMIIKRKTSNPHITLILNLNSEQLVNDANYLIDNRVVKNYSEIFEQGLCQLAEKLDK